MIIFDLDALADDSHRRHFLNKPTCPECRCMIYGPENCMAQEYVDKYGYEGELWKPDYDAYNAACDGDEAVEAVLKILNYIKFKDQHAETDDPLDWHEIHIWSSRCESVRKKTKQWLTDNHISYSIIKMRPLGDDSTQEELFEKWLEEIDYTDLKNCMSNTATDFTRIEMVFSSHGPTIQMFRKRNVFVFDCNQGSL